VADTAPDFDPLRARRLIEGTADEDRDLDADELDASARRGAHRAVLEQYRRANPPPPLDRLSPEDRARLEESR
jgi:hypothetical protein